MSKIPDSYVSYLPPVTDTIDMVYTEDKQSSKLNYTSPIVRGVVAVTLIAVVVGSFMYLSRRTSPWLDNGDNIYFTKGNVGVGSTSPGHKLDVVGTTRSDVFRTTAQRILVDDVTGYGRVGQNRGTEDSLLLYSLGNVEISIDANNTVSDRAFIVGKDAFGGGAELFRVQENGNVGIGVANPNSKLQVGAPTDQIYDPNPLNENVVSIFGPGCTPAIGGNADLNGTLFINSTDSYVPGTGASIAIGGRSTNFGGGEKHMTYGRISGIPGSGYRGNLVLETTNNGQVFERMRIDHVGNVGIGTNNPAAKLEVYDGADDYARIQGGTIRLKNGAGSASLVMQSEPTIAIIGTEGSQGLQLLTSSLPRLSITGTGNVGIGTNDPATKLHVRSDQFEVLRLSTSNAAGPQLALHNDTNVVSFMFIKNDFDGDGSIRENALEISNTGSGGKIHFMSGGGDTGNPHMVIAPGGNVGIGTATPDSNIRLQVKGWIASTFADGSPRFIFAANDTGVTGSEFGGYIGRKYNSVSPNTQLYTFGNLTGEEAHAFNNPDNSRLMTIKTSGNVGIGTDDPQVRMHVDKNIGLREEEGEGLNRPVADSQMILSSSSYRLYMGSYYTGGVAAYAALQGSDTYADPDNVIRDHAGPILLNPKGGNVGIGTFGPMAKLHLHSDQFDVLRLRSSAGPHISLDNGNPSVLSYISMSASSAPGIRSNALEINNGHQTGAVTFTVGGNVSSPQMVLASNGNVGIGIMDPAKQLHVATQAVIGYRPGVSGGVLLAETAAYGIPAVLAVDSGFAPTNLALNPVSGNVGIGTDDPKAKLHVQGSISDSFPWVQYWDSAGIVNGDENYAVSIYASNTVVADVFATVSDARIKKDLQNINDGDALAKLRLIEPTEYNYIDRVNKTTKRVYGFIAQQVREHFPEATVLSKDFIPDIYCLHAVDLALQTISVPSKARTGKLRIMTKTRQLDVEVTCPGPDVVQLPEGTLTEEHLHEGNVFVYGYEVEDFHTLNKDYLFTINFAATQELDRQVVQLKSENQGLRSELQALSTEKESLKTRLTVSETEVSGLRSELQALRDVLREKGLIE